MREDNDTKLTKQMKFQSLACDISRLALLCLNCSIFSGRNDYNTNDLKDDGKREKKIETK